MHREGRDYYVHLPFLGEAAERRIFKTFDHEEINTPSVQEIYFDVLRPRQQETRWCSLTSCPTINIATCFVKNCVYEITCSSYDPSSIPDQKVTSLTLFSDLIAAAAFSFLLFDF